MHIEGSILRKSDDFFSRDADQLQAVDLLNVLLYKCKILLL